MALEIQHLCPDQIADRRLGRGVDAEPSLPFDAGDLGLWPDHSNSGVTTVARLTREARGCGRRRRIPPSTGPQCSTVRTRSPSSLPHISWTVRSADEVVDLVIGDRARHVDRRVAGSRTGSCAAQLTPGTARRTG